MQASSEAKGSSAANCHDRGTLVSIIVMTLLHMKTLPIKKSLSAFGLGLVLASFTAFLMTGRVAMAESFHDAAKDGSSRECRPDAVATGPACLDKYEASLWFVPASQTRLISKIRSGTARREDLLSMTALSAGVVQLGLRPGDLGERGCPTTANGCIDVYAVSIAGVNPASFVTWFQALATARNSGKRLATNQEWQAGALGTPDAGFSPGPRDCNTYSTHKSFTGSRVNCKSDVGAFDMVGNVREWVAEWVPRSSSKCLGWGEFSDDFMCLAGADDSSAGGPGVIMRGGSFAIGEAAGVFAVSGDDLPTDALLILGFRAAR
jgi:hypothetical protein